jgi:hypothetical protein
MCCARFETSSNPVPTKLNPLGAKGAGKAGCVGALPSVMLAIVNALEPLDVRPARHAGNAAQGLAGDQCCQRPGRMKDGMRTGAEYREALRTDGRIV